ncbi:hypothetical protein GOV10_05585 [Candidatus Woesearchaeota archaeon]|nr:hypothetical protein [Candidatus Woesearchaeota archaeon]
METAALLQQIGLSDGEQKVYLALIELGEATSGPIATKSSVSASKIYEVAGRLMKKGPVGVVDKKGVKHFRATHPKAISNYLTERKRELEAVEEEANKLLPQLTAQYEEKAEETEVELKRGMKSLRNTFHNLISELKKDEEYVVIGGSLGTDAPAKFRTLLTNYHNQRAEKGIKMRMLFQNETPVLDAAKKNSQIRFLPPSLQSPLQINVHGETTDLILLLNEPIIFTIKNKNVAKAFSQYFEQLWELEQQ